MEIVGCPECSGPAEVLRRDVLESTDGPIEHVKIACINRHNFFMPTDRLESPNDQAH